MANPFVTPSHPAGGGSNVPFFATPKSVSVASGADTNTFAAHLRRLIASALASQSLPTAIFYADKLISLQPPIVGADTDQSPPPPPLDDVRLLGECFYRARQYRRALHVLRQRTLLFSSAGALGAAVHNLDVLTLIRQVKNGTSTIGAARSDRRTILTTYSLAIRCFAECKEYDDALLVLGADDHAVADTIREFGDESAVDDDTISLQAVACCVRGQIYEALQNRARAINWYTRAVKYDVRCVEAFDRLIESRMLSAADETALFTSLTFTAETEWIKLVYANRIQQFDPAITVGNDPLHDTTLSLTMLTPKSVSVSTPLHSSTVNGSTNALTSPTSPLISRLSILSSQYHIVDNVDLYSVLLTQLYLRADYVVCLSLSQRLLDRDPYDNRTLLYHICTLTLLHRKSPLFYLSHQLVQSQPALAITWFAVGSYYYTIGKYDVARKFYQRAVVIEPFNMAAHMAFANTFAFADESDAAMTAYRTCARLFDGSHAPLCCIGQEYIRNGNHVFAQTILARSHELNPHDPLVLNELGVCSYHRGQYRSAIELFESALAIVTDSSALTSSTWSVTWANLGHAYRRLGEYESALNAYQTAQSNSDSRDVVATHQRTKQVTAAVPASASGTSAMSSRSLFDCIGMCYHLMNDITRAIESYHRALADSPRDTIVQTLLQKALAEAI